MDGNTILNGIWTFLNSGIGFAAHLGRRRWAFSSSSPASSTRCRKVEAVRGQYHHRHQAGREQIPDDTPNAGLAKLDAPLLVCPQRLRRGQ